MKTGEAIQLTDPSQVDLSTHAVIEASAGTGKTYTIENLVVRLLREGVPIDRILLVTFTEKATGELKERIRAKIEDGASHSDSLRTALENFEAAQISTIHSFCQRVLREYAFENSLPFESELADDDDIYQQQLYQVMREKWPAIYGEDLPAALHLSGYLQSTVRGENQWERTTLEIARRLNPQAGDELLPPLNDCFGMTLRRMENALSAARNMVGQIPADSPVENSFYQRYGELNFNQRSKNARQQNILLPLLQLLAATDGKNDSPEGSSDIVLHLQRFFAAIRPLDYYRNERFNCLVPGKWNKGRDNQEDKCPELDKLVAALESLADAYAVAGLDLALRTILLLQEEAASHKTERGLVGYDDMLLLVHQALDSTVNPKAGHLIRELKRRYQIALVDEFQDTDHIQWQIFRRIFVDVPSNGNRLMVVGDPKQAIYGFRGADLYAYFRAKEHLLQHAGAKLYNLPTNWRSTPAMIRSLNPIFESGNWFSGQSPIRFSAATVPEARLRRARLYKDNSGRPAVTLFSADSLQTLAPLIAAEINRLLNPPVLTFSGADGSRDIRADDICILVRKAKEAILLEKALQRRRIPFTYYKKPGLFQSDEAFHLATLLRAVADPGNGPIFKLALLTPFFRVGLRSLDRHDELPHEHAIRRLFREWRELGARRQWSRLFHSIFEKTGILYHQSDDINRERRLTNLEHIAQELEQAAVLGSFDLVDLANHLNRLRSRRIEVSQEADLHRLETDKPKIQIMTIHASKGLEFPVVFLAGGFSGLTGFGRYCKFHASDPPHQLRYDLSGANREAGNNEEMDESRRLFYVALTRAIYKLYLPVSEASEAKTFQPIRNLVSRSVADAWSGRELPRDELSPEPASARERKNETGEIDIPEVLLPTENHNLRHRTIEVDSFSGIHRRLHAHEPDATPSGPGEIRFADLEPRKPDDEVDESLSPAPEEDPLPENAVELPHGLQTGNLLHAVLERIDFQAVHDARTHQNLIEDGTPSSALIEGMMHRFGLPPQGRADGSRFADYREEIARIVWNALNVPLPPDGIRLGGVPPGDRLSELEFYYPLPRASQLCIPEIENEREGYVTGSIDLVFRNGDKVCIVDWKSNYSRNGYGEAAVRSLMEEGNYHLQYKIYALAVQRWLKKLPGNLCFDGIYYLFLRGINGESVRDGVFLRNPSREEVQHYAHELHALVNG